MVGADSNVGVGVEVKDIRLRANCSHCPPSQALPKGILMHFASTWLSRSEYCRCIYCTLVREGLHRV